jgi:hypothetical protein
MTQPAFYRRDSLELAQVTAEGSRPVAYWSDWSRYGLGFGLMERTKVGGWTGPLDHVNSREEAAARLDRMAADLNTRTAEGRA